mgnify:CR=1 FL=1
MYEKHGFGWLLYAPLELFTKKRTGNRNNSQSFLLWKQFKTKKDKTLIGKEKEWRIKKLYVGKTHSLPSTTPYLSLQYKV